MFSLQSLNFWGHYGGKKIGCAGPANTERPRNAPSGMQIVQHRNLQELLSGFATLLVAICRYPLFFVCEAICITLAVFGGSLRRKKSGVGPMSASCNIIRFWGYPTQAMIFTLFQNGISSWLKTDLFRSLRRIIN